ncbi:HRDC domain-containing protein [Microbacterium xanthum]|uniref:HRDC domain-containing protein n=1 Tax=Microbacterium xanthum TaxID=3079794 RepID=UPI002AD224AD|nr:HRDC domain-containing protein [Microbacterium sp. KSW-48]MDZ8172782.1 HRDC domain-containing protein [Microbacterium sp. KSW-48]
MSEYTVIAERDAFLAACTTLAAAAGPVAVDVERASGFRYSQRAYLIQVFRRDAGVFLFDPPALDDFAPLQEAIGDAEWVLHAASQDLPSLRELGLEPPRLFDTELAARLLGHERVGLGAVVENTLGIALAKAHSASDWSQRPLPQSWLEYAALDVLHLVDVRDVLARELREQDKTEIAAEEFADVRDRPAKPPRDEPWRRLSGLHAVRGRKALAVARALWTAREEFAEAEDIAPGRLVPDRALVAAVVADPRSKHDLAALKEFTGRASRSELDRWWQAIERGRADPTPPRERATGGDTLPPPRAWAQRNPDADLRLKAARPAVEELATNLHMPTENLLTPDTLRRVAWTPPEPVDPGSVADALRAWGAREWQVGRTAQVIADAFVGSVQHAEKAADPAS